LSRGAVLKVLTFVILSYMIALALDIAVLWSGLPVFLWGFARMWCVTLSVFICLVLYRESVSGSFRKFLRLSRRAVVLYLLAPLMAYGVLGLYVVLALPMGLFDFSAYVEIIADSLRKLFTSMSEEQVIRIATISAYTQVVFAYLAAVTINAFFALGEEIGWRGYLYDLLGYNPSLRNTVIVGVLWGLWHAPATILLGYNYQINRYLGVALFTLLTIALTYPHLLITTTASSVLPAASLHGAVNALWSLTTLASNLPTEQKEIYLGLGILGITTWVIACVIFHTIKLLTRKSFHELV